MSTPRRRRKDREPLSEIDTPGTVSTAAGDPNPVERVEQPTHDEIARRAYRLYEEFGGEHRRHLEDWLQAERQLRQFLQDAVGES